MMGILLGGCFMQGWSENLPDNIYFRAMHDEMQRSLSKLRVKGNAKPYYLAYQLELVHSACTKASLGEIIETTPTPYWGLSATAVLAAGTPKNDSMGFVTQNYSSYQPQKDQSVPDSYWGIRHALWQLTDDGYVAALDAFEKKQAYRRQKNIPQTGPDFSRAKQSAFVEEIVPFPHVPQQEMIRLAKKLSGKGKDISFLEDLSVDICLIQRDFYYLNSDGGMYQYTIPLSRVRLSGKLRNREGYKETLSRTVYLPADQSFPETRLMSEMDQMLASAEGLYRAQKPEPYLGPVLLTPAAAARFFNGLFIENVRNIQPRLSSSFENDPTAGSFRNKQGMRLMSNVVEVYDKPSLRMYEGIPLLGFMPVDDEGVKAQDLTLVSEGRLQQLPLSRRSAEKGGQSNGHARMSSYTLPREALSNVWIKPIKPLSETEMEQKLLQRCRELDLEYCYILHDFPASSDSNLSINMAERIYTKDGHKEPVFGFQISDRTTRSLRDILAAGSDSEVYHSSDAEARNYSVITPSLLVDEVEMMPDDKKPDQKPFINKP